MDERTTPPAEVGGYNQTYVVFENEGKETEQNTRKVLFRCGNWAYYGGCDFPNIHFSTADIPKVIPILQRQQKSLHYFALANSLYTPMSPYCSILTFLRDLETFVIDSLTSPELEAELEKWRSLYPWIDDDAAPKYFELQLHQPLPSMLRKVSLMASKTYTSSGLILISLVSGNSFFFLIQPNAGDQPLLDIRFPDVSRHGQGVTLASYQSSFEAELRREMAWLVGGGKAEEAKAAEGKDDDEDDDEEDDLDFMEALSYTDYAKKLVLWHNSPKVQSSISAEAIAAMKRSIVDGEKMRESKEGKAMSSSQDKVQAKGERKGGKGVKEEEEGSVVDVSSDTYMQAYVIRKNVEGMHKYRTSLLTHAQQQENLDDEEGSKKVSESSLMERVNQEDEEAFLKQCSMRDVLFRFGSWCYSGQVTLAPTISLADIPYVIPALRLQQSSLSYVYNVQNVPKGHVYGEALAYLRNLFQQVELLMATSEGYLEDIVQSAREKEEKRRAAGKEEEGEEQEHAWSWLEETDNLIFEFAVDPDPSANHTSLFSKLDVICGKSYHASGVTTMIVAVKEGVFATLSETNLQTGRGEGSGTSLLDARFPAFTGLKRRGIQLGSFPEGVQGWEDVRRMSVWQIDSSRPGQRSKEPSVKAEPKESVGGERRLESPSKIPVRKVTLDDDDDEKDDEEKEEEKEEKFHLTSPSKLTSLDKQSKPNLSKPSPSKRLASVPHHLPSSSLLQERLAKLQLDAPSDMVAPWDLRGNPLGAESKSEGKK